MQLFESLTDFRKYYQMFLKHMPYMKKKGLEYENKKIPEATWTTLKNEFNKQVIEPMDEAWDRLSEDLKKQFM